MRARPVATRRFAPRSRPSPLNYTDPSGFSAETNEDIAIGVGAGYFTGLAVHLLTSGGTAATAGATTASAASAASAGADAVAAGAGAASAAPALAAAGAGAGFATSFAMNVIASGRQPTSSVVSAPPSTRSATAGGAGTPPLGRSAYSTMAISPVQEKPANLSLFAPERGALAQNFQRGGYCHEDGPCQDFVPVMPLGMVGDLLSEIANTVKSVRDWFRPRARFPKQPGQIKHIFRNDEAHLPDTPGNRALLQDVADDANATLGTDKFGNVWSARTLDDGTQVWVQTRNSVIQNGGLNQTPRVFNSSTGLSGK